MDKLFLVAIGGGAGAVMRYLLGVASLHRFGSAWPMGTLLTNVSGGLLMGLLVGWLAQRSGADQERIRLLLGVGLLGGFTTFSAFSLETALMIERRAYGEAFGYALVSVVVSVTALFAGLMLMRRFA
ncbi:fluoride efflux transporter CrcB [Phenylobacterium sp.]|uniref:fluoride efflux transporter CrcB n=1 Tax=Phenylobacterium sp. TaxID=1871053 RepID=UPI00272F8C8E|nr:fluoride efflux transporter CrcB [Phenylobacterium sp.]MDP1874050.1 fluoride efflux transporter CrcB [Phenylobacterium sp.]MDP3490008.1 fluoride efflux transporter CrcB [Phenylobacterium sp.]